MRKLLFPILFLGIALMGIISCEKVEFTEEDALENQIDLALIQDSLMRDSLLLVDQIWRAQDSITRLRDSLASLYGVIQYTVKVIDGGESSILKSTNNALDGASVTVTQHGQTATATTVGGEVVFDDLRIGTLNVRVVLENYTELNYIVQLPIPAWSSTFIPTRSYANMVTVFPLTGPSLATVSGQVTIDTDLTNTQPEIASDVLITATIDVDNSNFQDRFVDNDNHTDVNPTSNLYGDIIQMAYSSVVMSATTDATGAYSIQLPSTGDADGLTYNIEVSEFAQDQTLYMQTRYDQTLTVDQVRQTVRTIFGSDLGWYSSIPTVRPVYVEFSDPTGAEFNQPSVQATAVAHIGESGIQNIQISDRGEGYTQAPQVIITSGSGGEGAEATATVVDGEITEIVITSEGSGYTSGTTTVDLSTVVDDIATATAEVTYEIESITVNNAGSNYSSAPSVQIVSAMGSGATASANMTGVVDDITVTAGGTGYTAAPNVILTGGGGNGATATATMSTYNKIHSISVLNFAVDTFTTAPRVRILTAGTGSGAQATASLSTAGGTITAITMTNVGAGYIDAPTVTITGGGGHGAQAEAVVVGGAVTVNLLDGGEGYTSTPTISITAAPTGGTNATATATVGRGLSSVTLTANGNGYDNAANVIVQFQHPDLDPVTDPWSNDATLVGLQVYLDMSVRSVTVTNGGSDYTTAPTVVFSPANLEGSGATATASISQEIESIDVTNGGSGYNSAVEPIYVNIGAPDDGGTQATATANQGNGTLSAITITNGGEGYTAPPIVELTGGGVNAVQGELSATVLNGSVTSITIDDAGSGYTSAPAITIKTYESAAVATATVNVTAGQIEWIEVTNPGEGYTVVPTVEIIPQDNVSNDVIEYGTGAQATAVLDAESGKILEIVVDDPGQGYYRAPDVRLTIPSYNQTAKGYAIVNSDGIVTGVDLVSAGTSKGNGYITEPTVTFTGVNGIGSGAEGIVRISGGQVQEVIMTDGGSGYTAQNTPGNYFPVNSASAAGQGYSVWGSQTGSTMTVFYGQTYVRDIYLGTGQRVEEY